MASPFVAEIRIAGFNFAPRNWATCDGQLLPISQNTALFSLLGTNYGGNGTSNFALPNLEGSAPLHFGQGPGLSSYVIGETGGAQAVTLLPNEMPQHTHTAMAQAASTNPAPQLSPASNVWAVAGSRRSPVNIYAPGAATTSAMNPLALNASGGSQPHGNLHPYLGMMFIICLQGVYPPRS